MRSSKQAEAPRNLRPARPGRVLAIFLLLLAGAELLARSVTLYPYVPGQRFHNLWSTAALAPNGRQIGDALDDVSRNAKPGDWVLMGDSILNGTHVPSASTPAAVIRQRLKERGSQATVWDLTVVGADPAMYLAMLDRLGPLPGVMLVTNVSVKLVTHPNLAEMYFPQLWDEMASWNTTSERDRDPLERLRGMWFENYARTHLESYGDNVAEARASVWANTHVALLTLDHWLRFHRTTFAWPQLFSQLALAGQPVRLYGAKDYDVIWQEWPHEPVTKILEKQDAVRQWFARVPEPSEPLWHAYTLFLDRLRERGKLALLSLHTVSPYHVKLVPADFQQDVEKVYAFIRQPALDRGIPLVEPRGFMPEVEYTDFDHFGVAGNRRWTEEMLRTAGF